MCGALNEHSQPASTDSINAHTALGMLEPTVAGFSVFREELMDFNNSLPVTVRHTEDTLLGYYVGAMMRVNLLGTSWASTRLRSSSTRSTTALVMP